MLNGLDETFAKLQAHNISTVASLLKSLVSPVKIAALAAATEIAPEYLSLLKRETGTLQRKPVELSAFPDTDAAQVEVLANQGITNTKEYFETREAGGRLYALCDLTRINGVGPNAAAMFYKAGYRSAAEIAHADAVTMLKTISAVNADTRYYAGTLGMKDIKFCIEYARLLQRFTA